MMNYIWVTLIGISVVAGICTGSISDVQDNLFCICRFSSRTGNRSDRCYDFLLRTYEGYGRCRSL